MQYLAHIAADGREQTVQAHLEGTAVLAAQFARPFGAEGQAELAGLAHDLGKYSAAFQRRLQGQKSTIPLPGPWNAGSASSPSPPSPWPGTTAACRTAAGKRTAKRRPPCLAA